MLILDLSNNNGEPDWPRLKSQGIDAVYLKAGEGGTFVDPNYQARKAAARKVGLLVGGYWFARPETSDAVAEAREAAKVVGKFGAHDLRLALDFEAPSQHLTPAQLVSWARQFNQEFKRITGVLPAFYTYSAYAQMLAAKTPIGAGLWLASYDRNDGKEHPFVVPAPWKAAAAHQFSSRCSVGGCAGLVDMSHAKSIQPLLAHPVKHRVAKVLPYLGRH